MAITDRISKQELEELYLIQNLSDEKIGKIYNVAGSTIFAARKKYNIPTLEQYQKHHKQELSLKEKEFLIGTLLGDAHVRLRKNKKAYPQFMFEQTTKHKEYFLWIKAQIIDWLYNPHLGLSDYFGTHKKNGKEYSSYSLRTICEHSPTKPTVWWGSVHRGWIKEYSTNHGKSNYTKRLFIIQWHSTDG